MSLTTADPVPGSPPRSGRPPGPVYSPRPGRELSFSARLSATTHPLASDLRRRRDGGQPSARSLLLTVLGEYVLPLGEPTWTGALVAGLALQGVGEKAARQALARAAAEGWIVSLRHGRRARWDLTDAGRRLLADGAQRIYSFGQDAKPWDGRWLVLLVSDPDTDPGRRRLLATRLSWAGFGRLPSGVWISPDPAREAEADQILDDLGLSSSGMSFVASHGAIGVQADIVDLAWDLGTLELRYKRFLDTFRPLDPVTSDEILVAQTLLVHEWRRFPFLDPQLPRDLLPAGWLGTEAARLFRARHAKWRDASADRWAVLAGA